VRPTPTQGQGGGLGVNVGQVPAAPRSSNLRLKKEFTDFDRDKFLHDAFDYIAKFFDASLAELAARNECIQVRFQRPDARSFAAVIYRAGKTMTKCSVRIPLEPSSCFTAAEVAQLGDSEADWVWAEGLEIRQANVAQVHGWKAH
jgi:hypothetical protein